MRTFLGRDLLNASVLTATCRTKAGSTRTSTHNQCLALLGQPFPTKLVFSVLCRQVGAQRLVYAELSIGPLSGHAAGHLPDCPRNLARHCSSEFVELPVGHSRYEWLSFVRAMKCLARASATWSD